jgi:hypothetical protein
VAEEVQMSNEKPKIPRRVQAGPHITRGVSILQVEDSMLNEIMQFANPRAPNRSAAMGQTIRTLYELLISHGKIPANPELIPAHEFQGWAERWGIECKKDTT